MTDYNPMAGCERPGRTMATPGCDCRYCRAVFEDWGREAEEYERWMNGLPDWLLLKYFGLVRKDAKP